MATKKDLLSELIAANSKTKVLDRKWRSRKPEKADFDLEGVDIQAFCVGRKKFYAEKEKEAENIKQNIPDEKAKVSLDFGWEGWTMLALCVVLFGYIKFFGMPGRMGQIIISALCILVVGMYVMRAGHVKHMRKLEIEEMKAEVSELRKAKFKEEETYEVIEAYAAALFDYEEWQLRRKPAYWKEISDSDARETIFSLYDMLGMEPDGTYDEYLDFTIETGEGLSGVMCPGSKKLTQKMAEGFAADLADAGIPEGIIYATGQVEQGAKDVCEGKGGPTGDLKIEIRGLDDIMKLVGETDKE